MEKQRLVFYINLIQNFCTRNGSPSSPISGQRATFWWESTKVGSQTASELCLILPGHVLSTTQDDTKSATVRVFVVKEVREM